MFRFFFVSFCSSAIFRLLVSRVIKLYATDESMQAGEDDENEMKKGV